MKCNDRRRRNENASNFEQVVFSFNIPLLVNRAFQLTDCYNMDKDEAVFVASDTIFPAKCSTFVQNNLFEKRVNLR